MQRLHDIWVQYIVKIGAEKPAVLIVYNGTKTIKNLPI